MGDGTVLTGATVHHTYVQDGDYIVKLSVLDSDGSNVSKSITVSVQDTDPEVGSIYTGGNGGTSFAKHTNVTFTVEAVQGYDPLSYRWLITTSAGTIFEQTTSVPSFYYRFDEGGSYTVRVFVNDTDDSVDRNIQIDIIDSPPVAIFTYEVSTTEGMVYFSANQSYDPDGDTPNLQYRWAFGDGSSWTDWNSTYRTIYHQYFNEGVFDVFLQVSDGSNAAVQNSTTVILDRTPPSDHVPRSAHLLERGRGRRDRGQHQRRHPVEEGRTPLYLGPGELDRGPHGPDRAGQLYWPDTRPGPRCRDLLLGHGGGQQRTTTRPPCRCNFWWSKTSP